ncbi:MAG: hypothetical protein K1X89_24060, partial [Myxococcaceae bacterium]|nr:hypothetical protein [Myxococcaceae bacterium]
LDAGSGPSVVTTTVAPALPPAATPSAPLAPASPAEREAALKGPWLEKWKFLAREQSLLEGDRDYTQGFLASKELRACDCTRVNAAAMARAIEQKEGGESGLSLMRAEDQPNTRCTVCLLDAFPAWRARADKQCALLNQLTDFEVERLARSDDANGLPPRCFEESKKKRAELAASRPAPLDAGTTLVASASGQRSYALPPSSAPAAAPATPLPPNTYLLPKPPPPPPAPTGPAPKVYYYKPPPGEAPPPAPAAPPAPPAPVTAQTGPMLQAPTGPGNVAAPVVDAFVPPTAWAPIPNREEGRLYVRLSMSAACVAEVWPGPVPMQARTGDLLLLPWDTTAVTVRSPCGGVAEVYFGREAKPRHSDVFSKAQPVRFEFKTR